ncbi:rRNA methyltransferase [Paraoerskovia sediminicola]|uniref:rRNA methyltransferase n=1 Tax=Paraoerskovia sediminicola TaxID=1138587 RepID=A0ABN6XJR9_9CELL|nr:RNA methyltransferase [Paraoerskovia sediminicola]BDZ43801.1 rRNA methyltransferase [Paraoerskovia sediminicola]
MHRQPNGQATVPPEPTLTNPRSDRVRAVRALSGRSARLRHGQFLVEGPQSVRELVRHAAPVVRDVYLTPDAAVRYDEIVQSALSAGLYVHVASVEVLRTMSPDSQGVLAVALSRGAVGPAPAGPAGAAAGSSSEQGSDDAAAPALEGLLSGSPSLVAVLASVRDPGNAGTVVRAADAAGADGVVLAGESVDVHNPKVVRSTAGSLFHLPVVTGPSVEAAVAAARAAGLVVLAADGSGEHDLDDLLDVAGPGGSARPGTVPDLAAPTAWLFGNEAWGLRDDDLALADAVVRVPIRGLAESLNLATAATVCLYASSRAQRTVRVPEQP